MINYKKEDSQKFLLLLLALDQKDLLVIVHEFFISDVLVEGSFWRRNDLTIS